ncbi:hypothetical protein FFWV33_09860 [Flavobacterium faecale]|uniref:2TM domain-containing protein n=2 Tax=Flavobacterium faecale TaxID=1355330 RepID=A0A2S1LIM8_9FLAO|nr:hypothetical protein FFWV33_09860 [Flavobacterium faecale]
MMRKDKRILDNYDLDPNSDQARYNAAYKRVKRIKGFYVHLLVCVLVNAFILISIVKSSGFGVEMLWKWETWSTALFWGIGIVVHGWSVFGKNYFFGSDWEEKKMKEFMSEEESNKWE